MAGILLAVLPMALAGCRSDSGATDMNMSDEQSKVLAIIDSYARALDTGDADLWESLYWLDEPSFLEIENDKPYVLDRRYIEQIAGMMRTRGPFPPNQRWYDTKVFFLSPDVAYSISLRDEFNTDVTSRVTLVYLKKQGQWRIVHGHFSNVPE